MSESIVRPAPKYSEEEKPTTLQRHLDFFDPDGDGVFSVIDTYHGLRAIGFPIIFGFIGAFVINIPFSYPTYPRPGLYRQKGIFELLLSIPGVLWSYVPDPLFRIYIENIARDKHGSDTGTYTREGRFDRRHFDKIFTDWSHAPYEDSISFTEGVEMIRYNHLLGDYFGTAANIVEWVAVYYVLRPADGRCKKEDIRGIIDGSGFFKIAAERKAEGLKNKNI